MPDKFSEHTFTQPLKYPNNDGQAPLRADRKQAHPKGRFMRTENRNGRGERCPQPMSTQTAPALGFGLAQASPTSPLPASTPDNVATAQTQMKQPMTSFTFSGGSAPIFGARTLNGKPDFKGVADNLPLESTGERKNPFASVKGTTQTDAPASTRTNIQFGSNNLGSAACTSSDNGGTASSNECRGGQASIAPGFSIFNTTLQTQHLDELVSGEETDEDDSDGNDNDKL